jgi:R3H domain
MNRDGDAPRGRRGGGRQRGGRGRGRGRRGGGGESGGGGRYNPVTGPPPPRGAGGRGQSANRAETNPRGGRGGSRGGRTTIDGQRQGGKRAPPRLQRPEPPLRRNGEAGAETHTVSEEYRIKLSTILISLREDESRSSLEFPADLTNTERKFLHLLAGQLGLKSKSSGQGENRKITVSKLTSQKAITNEVIPRLRIGKMGEGALRDHLSRFPPNAVEIAESKQTGSGLLNEDAQEMLLRNAMIDIKPDEDYIDRPVNRHRRRQNHEAVQQRKQSANAFKTMLRTRAQLPAWSHEDEIVHVVAGNQVTIIVGETGCGKSLFPYCL